MFPSLAISKLFLFFLQDHISHLMLKWHFLQPMRIHVSESCHECLRGTEFETEFRGLIELKVCIIRNCCFVCLVCSVKLAPCGIQNHYNRIALLSDVTTDENSPILFFPGWSTWLLRATWQGSLAEEGQPFLSIFQAWVSRHFSEAMFAKFRPKCIKRSLAAY